METRMSCIAILSRSYYTYFMSIFTCNGPIYNTNQIDMCHIT
jgi:hypothetical protein